MKAIVAMDLNRVIGKDGKLPWKNLKGDLKFFKETTSNPQTGGYLLMGRKTFESTGILPNRFTYVLTNNTEKLTDNIDRRYHRYITEEHFLQIMEPSDKIWVCGGAEVYRKFIPLCTEVYVTLVLDEYDGDTRIDPFEDDFPNQTLLKQYKTHWIVKYSK